MVMGGAERFVLNLVQQLNSRGWHVSIVTTSPSENKWRHEFEQLTEDIFVLPDFLKIADFGKFINYLIESRGVNILFTQGSIEGYRLLPYISRNNPDLSIVDYLHFVTEDWMDGGFPELSAIYESYIDRTIVSSEQLKRWLITRQINPDKISVCYIGVDADFWTKDIDKRSAFRKNYNLNDDDFVILFAGRLEEQKSPLFLLDILKEPGLKGLKIKTLVAGEGSLKPAMLKKIKELGLENSVALIGEVSTADMPGFLNAGDVFFLPSKNEGISSAVYEAMSVGLPVIASNVGGQDELVDEGSGYLVDADANDAALVFARHILDLYSDKEKRIGIGQHARKRIEANFTLDKMGTRIDSILKAQLFMEKSSKARFPERQVAELQDQLTIEYLQARNEWNKLNILHTQLYRQFEKLNEPKPTSHWFYLWVRQLFLPIYRKLNTGKKQKGIQRIKEFVLKFLKPSTGSD
jgi:glycosyltransferase involved in cell wall biosynthesis